MLKTNRGSAGSLSAHGFTLIELLIALFISALLTIGIEHLFSALTLLHDRQIAVAHLEEKTRNLTQILRIKMQKAGDWSCQSKKPRSIVIRRYNAHEAADKLNITIKPKTNLLQIHECTRFHGKIRYLPINFYVDNTGREDTALYIQVTDHRRQEMITDVNNFLVTLYRMPHKKNNIRAVKIDYLLSSKNFHIPKKVDYWFHDKWIMPTDFHLYQPGIVYAAVRSVV